MSKILIENYRGFDIEFDTEYEKFQCIITEDLSKESGSYAAVKKFVDDYKKENQGFQPFWVESIPSYSYTLNHTTKLKIIGIRKDGRLFIETQQGEKDQLPDYQISSYMLQKEENQSILRRIQKLNAEESNQRAKNDELRKNLIDQINMITLRDYKKTLLDASR